MRLRHLLAANAWSAAFFGLARAVARLTIGQRLALADGIIFAVAAGLTWCVAWLVASRVLAPDGRGAGDGRLATAVASGGVAAAVGVFVWAGW